MRMSTIGYLATKTGRQVTVTKTIDGKLIEARSAQINCPYEVTFYECDNRVAFSFECDGKHCFPKVEKQGLELAEHAIKMEVIPDEYYFKWAKENQGDWHRLVPFKSSTNERFLCCGEDGSVFLRDNSSEDIRVECYLYQIVLKVV